MARNSTVDIVKGILIILVVVAHLPFKVSDEIYYFHMPAFFMVTGFFLPSYPKIGFGSLIKRMKSLLIPYVTYLFLLSVPFILLSDRSWHLSIIKIFLGGRALHGIYSPFWFITALAGAFLLYYLIEIYITKQSLKIGTIVVCYLLAHAESMFFSKAIPHLFYLPLALDVSLIVVCYLYLGKLLKTSLFKLELKRKQLYIAALPVTLLTILFLYANQNGVLPYSLDLKYVKYQSLWGDICVPLLFFLFVYIYVAILQKPLKILWMDRIGKASLSIMYLHMPIILALSFIKSDYILVCLAVIISFIFHRLFALNPKISFLFLGKGNVS